MKKMSKTSSLGFGKNSQSKGAKTLKNNYVGRGEMIEPDKYYAVFDENISLKKKVYQLEKDNKKLSTTLQYNKIQNPIKEEAKSELKTDNRTLQIENENLRNKNKRLNEKVQSLEKYLNQAKPKSYNNSQIYYNSSGKNYPNIYQKKDYEEVISRLRQTLNNYRENYDKLSNELSNLREGGASKAIIDYSNDIRDKNFKLSELGLEFDKLKEKYESNLKILEITKKTYEEYVEKYTIERNKNLALENELQKQKSALDQMDEYANRIKEYEKNEKLLEGKIMDLCENPFIKQINERDNTFAALRETQMALSEAQTQLKLNHDNIMELNRQLKELEHKYEKVKLERDQFKEEALRYKIDKEEREKQGKEFDAIFSRISQFGEVDSNYEKLMNLLKGKLSKDSEGKNWENIDFLEKMDEFPDSKDELKKEIQRLRREKGILGEELEKTKTLLSVIQQLNDDMKKKQDLDSKAYLKQINSLKDKLRRLTELIDRRNLPPDFDLNSIYKKDAVPQRLIKEEKIENEKEIERYNPEIMNKSVYTSITGFSKDSEEDFTIDENCLDLYITNANYDVECVQNKLGLQIDDLKSFISVDFYLHPTQISDMMEGKNPNYNLQLSFKVTVDENLIKFLQDEFIQIELYQLKSNTQIIFASGKIPLNQLIIIENDSKTRVVKGYIEMFYIEDSSIKICDIKYKMRMRKSILDKIKWIEEKNQIFKELDPINEANRKIMGELNIKQPLTNIMAYYDKDNINNKVYNVKIIINKGERLQKLGPITKIQPYLYYRFYNQNEHFSNILSGPDPLFDDIEVYTCVYTGNFHEYLNKESLNIYIFDGSNPIKVDTDGNEVEMVRNDNNSDLIGICKVTLRGLILNYKIEGKFPVLNEEGNVNLGYLEVNIIMEEIILDDEDKKNKNELDAKIIEGVDPILIKLAQVLRDKGLNMNSAFKLFDKDNEDLISLENFKSVVFFALKFISKEEDLKRLVDVVFKNKVVLDKQDFYQIFNNLLPLDDNFNYNKKTQILGENTVISFNVIDKQNNNINKNEINNYNTTGVLKQMNPNMTQNSNFTNYNNNNLFSVSNLNAFNNKAPVKRTSRALNEIMLKVDEYMIYFGKRTASDLFKIFDQDSNLKVGMKELADGFAKMGIALNPEELSMIWKKIVVSNNKENFGIEEFMVFYEKYKVPYKREQ